MTIQQSVGFILYSGLDSERLTITPSDSLVYKRYFAIDTRVYYDWDGQSWIAPASGPGGMVQHGNEYHDPDFATLSDIPAAITLLDVYPIGSIYTSVSPTNPGELFGGTWVSFGAGRVLVGLNALDPDFNTVEETGGAKTNTPNAHAGASVGNHTFTQPADHAAKNTDAANVGATKIGSSNSTATLKAHYHNITAYTHTGGGVSAHSVTQASDHAALSVIQPYITVYLFKRVS